jgi:Carboxypeptidase regulatory-like domain
MTLGKCIWAATSLFLVVFFAGLGFAQSVASALRGQVTDPSGAAVTNATIVVTSPAGRTSVGKTDAQGIYEVKGLAPGAYTVDVTAPGFALFEKTGLEIAAGKSQKLNIQLSIQVEAQKVEVTGNAPTVSTNPESNASAVVISGQALEALPDDPDELQSDLTALAGPSAGPSGGQIYIDGFTGGELPPKSSIREIRINQNPFSPQFDKIGYGRIEIFTKPGTDKLHGHFFISGNSSAFNSPNPFAGEEPGYDSTRYSGNIGGPLSKKASFFFSAQQRNINDVSAVNAVVLDPSLNPAAFSAAVPEPRRRTNISPRIDYQVNANNTLTVRYQYYRDSTSNGGVGQFDLASQGYRDAETEHKVQVSDTQVIGSKIVNETRFQYLRDDEDQTPLSTEPTVAVLQAFTGGGSNEGVLTDRADYYELQNYTSVVHGNHVIKFGARLRGGRDTNESTSGFNGAFTFPSLAAYQAAELALQSGATTAAGASQFTLTAGLPVAEVTSFDAGLYAGDDWRVRPNLTLSYGLRFETQTNIHDHADFAPRVGIAWGLGRKGSSPKTVLRAGFGIFYDRFKDSHVLQAERLNGITQQQFVVSDPTFFPMVPDPGSLTNASNAATVYQIDPRLHAPYVVQAAVSVDRQLGHNANFAISYLNSRGFDQLLSRNINAPLDFPANPSRPLGNVGNIYQFTSEGIFRQNQMFVNVNVRAASRISLFSYYVLNYADSDTDGASSFPSNQYNIRADYGRTSFGIRHRMFLGGTIALPYAFRLSPFMFASSGTPYDITVPNDLNGDSIFNDRPGLVSTAGCSTVQVTGTVYCTPLGTFDSAPTPGERVVPVNYGTGPARFTLNLRLSKTFGFGPETSGPRGGGGGRHRGRFGSAMGGPLRLGGATDRRYGLTFQVSARNILNKVNLATPNGTLGSPFFAKSNGLANGPFSTSAANRLIELQAIFSF